MGPTDTFESGTFRSALDSPRSSTTVSVAREEQLHFSNYFSDLKPDPMRSTSAGASGPQDWPSPTSIATHPTSPMEARAASAGANFSLDQQSATYYGSAGASNDAHASVPSASVGHNALPSTAGFYHPSAQTQSSSSWSAQPFNPSSGLLGASFPPPPQPQHQHQHVLNPLVLQPGEPLPRSTDDDLAFDAQMLREVLQEMPAQQPQQMNTQPQTQVQAQAQASVRGQQPQNLQLLFAAPLQASEMTVAVSQPAPGFFGNTLGLSTETPGLPMSMAQTQTMVAPVAPIYPPVASQPPRTQLQGVLPMPLGATGAMGLSGSLPPPPMPTLPKKKRTTATRICKVEGCTKGIRSRGLCKAHGGGRRCTTPGCTTSDQGGGHCVLHGGGRRCRIEGCRKSAQWRGVCKMHGGARRCRYGNCTKNGQVKQGYCRMHHNLLTSQRQMQEQQQQQVQQPPQLVVPASTQAQGLL